MTWQKSVPAAEGVYVIGKKDGMIRLAVVHKWHDELYWTSEGLGAFRPLHNPPSGWLWNDKALILEPVDAA